MSQELETVELENIIIFGCKLYNQNEIDKAHDNWELIWKRGSSEQKKVVKGFIQLSGATTQFNRNKMDSVKYLLDLSLKNIKKHEILHSIINIKSLIKDLEMTILNLENNNLNRLKINIKF